MTTMDGEVPSHGQDDVEVPSDDQDEDDGDD
jgi:hypothetical protein